MQQLIRGRVLGFHADPQDTAANHRYLEDGAILVEDGRILAVDDYTALARPDLAEIDHRPHLILPGFIDTHIHFPQLQVIASWGAQLLDWLNTYTFPEEARFRQQGHAPEQRPERFAPFPVTVREHEADARAFLADHAPGRA